MDKLVPAAPYDLHGAALLDCVRGDSDSVLVCHQDGVRDDVPASFWLRECLDDLEVLALDLCKGRVLDLGAGSGLHALELQRRGLEVVAIDISAACVEIMRERGVRDARRVDLYEFSDASFDSIVSLCNGLDKVGRLDDLPRFLDHMRTLLAPGGQLLADSFDVRVGASESLKRSMEARASAGRYFGEFDLRFEYRGRVSPEFSVLQVDFDTFAEHAARAGWLAEPIAVHGAHHLLRARPLP